MSQASLLSGLAGIQADPHNGYSYAPNGTGGVNYFVNGNTPVTNTQYRAATGQDTNAIEASVAKAAAAANAPSVAPPGPTNSNGTAGSGSATPKVDKSNDIALNNSGLSAVDSQTASGIAAIDKAVATLNGQYDTEKTANEKNYQTGSDTNQNNLQKNKQVALVNAAAGRQGLNGTLASLGALNGTGIDLATRAVQKGANEDLEGASSNYATNQSSLDTAIGQFRAEDEKRREDATHSADDAKTNARNKALTTKQTFLTNLSNDYAAEGDSANAKKFSDMAAALYPEIAGTSIPTSNITAQTAAYTPASLQSYLAGSNPTTVKVAPSASGTGVPGIIATSDLKKKTN